MARKKKLAKPAMVEQEVKKSEKCIYKVMNDKIMLAEVTLDKKFTYVNRSFRNFLGYEKGELTGMSFEEILHSDMPKCLCERAFEVASQGNSYHPAIWEGWIKSRNKDNSNCFWNTVFLQGIYRENKLVGFSILKRGASKEKIESISEIYQEIKKTGKSKNFCGNIDI